MHTLVTGGAGFIGSHLCTRLLEENHTVTCLDNLSTGNQDNIAALLENPQFTFIKHDITDPLPNFPYPFSRIYHLACPASPPRYQADSVKTGRTNVLGTLQLLELAQKHHARFLLTSTSEVYGDPVEHPQKESYRGNVNTVGLRSCYDEGKRMAETFTMDFHRQYGTDIRIVRIFNTYGPRMDAYDGRVVPTLVRQALNNEPLTIYGTGQQTRSFQYVTDLINGLISMMENTEKFIGPVNLGNPEEFTIAEFASIVKELTQTSSSIKYEPLPSDDPRQRCPDISLAQKQLHWQPKIALRQGLTETIAWYKNHLSTLHED